MFIVLLFFASENKFVQPVNMSVWHAFVLADLNVYVLTCLAFPACLKIFHKSPSNHFQ